MNRAVALFLRMRHLRLLAPLAVLVALVAAGCGGGGSKSLSGGDVAAVGSQAVPKASYDALLEQGRRTYETQKRPFPKAGTPEYAALRTQAVAFLVQRAEFEQKAKDLKITIDDKQVEARLTQIKKQYFAGSEKKYTEQLKQRGLTDKQVHDDIRSSLVSDAIFKKVTADVKVDDKAIQAYYDGHKSQYGQAESRDVRHILVKSKSLADKIYAQLKGGADFAALAKKYSQDPGSRTQGGKLTISKGQTVPPFDKVSFALKVNELSKPVHTTYGYHVIQALSAIRPAKTTALKDVKESIRQQLLQTKRNATMTKWVADTTKEFAKDVKYQAGFAPPAAASSGTTTG